jgi:hypothetical protein
LQNLSVNPKCQELLHSTIGTVTPLLLSIATEELATSKAKECAVGTLQNLSLEESVKIRLINDSAVPVFISMLTSPISTISCKEYCAGLLHNIAGTDAGRRALESNDGINALVHCLGSRTVPKEVHYSAGTCLHRLLLNNDPLCMKAIAVGAVSALRQVLQAGVDDPQIERCLAYTENRLRLLSPPSPNKRESVIMSARTAATTTTTTTAAISAPTTTATIVSTGPISSASNEAQISVPKLKISPIHST